MPRRPPEPREPGVSSEDAAIAAGQSGGTHRVQKHPDPETLPKSKVKGDPDRPADAAVNAKKEMSYAEAMKALEARNELDQLRKHQIPTEKQQARIEELTPIALQRNVLTEKGWVCVSREPPGLLRT